jgi:GWxTD domain-containing protein
LNAQFVVYHNTDSTSQLFYKIPNDAFIYKKTDTSELFYAFVKLFIKISDIDKLASPDTFSVLIFDPKKEVVSSEITNYSEFTLKAGKNYLIDVDVIDKFKKELYTFSVYSDKSSIFSKQNFIISDLFNQLYYQPYVKPNDVIYFKSERNKDKVFQVDVFKSRFRLATPPFSIESMPKFSYKPDSSFMIYQKEDRFELSLPQKGFYHVKTNSELKEGISFFVYESVYPKIKNTEQMILSTRFIMSKKEFDACLNASDQKAMIDRFWLDIAGSNERAKELIKKYYGRVQEANKLFLSYQEGWKTDRGMIYIVFGAPTRVTKYKNGEVWTYSNNGNSAEVNFTFTKILNPFTDNDYYLERGEQYKIPWYQAVDMWRQGRIYLDN